MAVRLLYPRSAMTPAFVRHRIKQWEILRVPFNAVCVIGAWWAWRVSNGVSVAIDESAPARFSDSGVVRDFILGFAVLNIAYCLVYAVEFMVAARSVQFWSRSARVALFCVGCVFGFVIAARGAAGIASASASEKRSQLLIEENINRSKREVPNRSSTPTASDRGST
jgi:hypothetical protein